MPFQQTGTSEFGDLAAYATTTVRLRIAELNLSGGLRTADEAPCHRTAVQGTVGSQAGSDATPSVPPHFLITGTIDAPSKAAEDQGYSLTYSLKGVANCQGERLIQETVRFLAPEALDRFQHMADAIAFRLEEELTDRALVAVDPIAPTVESDQARKEVLLLGQLIDHRLANSDDLRPVRDRSRADQAPYRLRGQLETQASGSRLGKLELNVEIGGKEYPLFTGQAPTDQSRDSLLGFFDEAIETSLRLVTEMRYRQESGLPIDPKLTDVQTVLDKSRELEKQGKHRAALGLLSGLPPSVDVLSLQGLAFMGADDYPASAKASDRALAAAADLTLRRRVGLLQNAGAAWYQAKEYSLAATRYTEMLHLCVSLPDAPETKAAIREAARWRVASLRFAGKRDEALSAYLEGRKLVDDPSDIDDEASQLLSSIDAVRELEPAVARLEAALGAESPVLAESRARIGDNYYQAHDYQHAQEAFRAALAAAEKAATPDQRLIARLNNSLGNVAYSRCSIDDEALARYETAVKITRKDVKPDAARLVIFLRNQAYCFRSKREFAQAEVRLKECRQLAEATFGPESVQTLDTLTALGQVYTDMGPDTRADARSLLEGVVRSLEKQSPRDENRLISSYKDLGWLNWEMDNSREAERLFRKAIEMLTARGETNTALYSALVDNVSSVYTADGRFAEALREQERAVQIAGAHGTDADKAQLAFNLCVSLGDMQLYSKAAAKCTDAFNFYRAAFASGHYMTGYSLLARADVRTAQAAFASAEEDYSKGAAIYGSTDQSRELPLRVLLGSLRYIEGRYREAEEITADALERLIKLEGSKDRHVGDASEALGWTQYRLGKPEAETQFRRCMDVYSSRGTPDHPTAASCSEGLGRIAIQRKDLPAAKRLCQNSLDARLKAFEFDSAAVADSLDCLGVIATAQGNYQEAEAQFKRARVAYENAFGPEHPKIAETLEHLADMRKASGHAAQAQRLESQAAAIRARFTWK